MAGGLTISTLNDSSGVLATQNGMSGIAKAWVNFNGTNGSIRSSFNVSSVTRSSTGIYTVNITTALPDTNYSRIVTSSGLSADGNGVCANTDVVYGNSITTTASAFGIFLTISGQSGYRDPLFVSASVFR